MCGLRPTPPTCFSCVSAPAFVARGAETRRLASLQNPATRRGPRANLVWNPPLALRQGASCVGARRSRPNTALKRGLPLRGTSPAPPCVGARAAPLLGIPPPPPCVGAKASPQPPPARYCRFNSTENSYMWLTFWTKRIFGRTGAMTPPSIGLGVPVTS